MFFCLLRRKLFTSLVFSIRNNIFFLDFYFFILFLFIGFILIFRLPCQVFFSTCRSTLDARHYLTWYKRRKNLACSSFNGPSGFGRSPCNRLRTTQLSCNFDDSDMVMDWRLSSGNRNSTPRQASVGYMGPLPGEFFVLSGLGSTI
jgi:hypothetical protein